MPSLLENADTFKNAIKDSNLTVIHFAADWAEQCKQVDELLDTLAKHDQSKLVKFYKCLAEDLSDISLEYKIEAVPTVLLFKNNQLVEPIHGANAAKISETISKYTNHKSSEGEPLEERLKKLVNHANVMLFMKGNREVPKCGFSRQIIEILNGTGVSYETFDILSDEEVRQGLKTFSNWPTYPQLYVKGELIGGLDIIKEMQAAGELLDALK